MLVEQSERYPEQLAVISGAHRATFGELAIAAHRVADGLSAAGVTRGDRVGVLINNRVEWLETCFGVVALGAVAVPFSTWSKRGEIDFLLADSRVNALITLDRLGELDFAADVAFLVPEVLDTPAGQWRSTRYPALKRIVMVGSSSFAGAVPYSKFVDGHTGCAELPAPEADDEALVLYTSGSSAHPKAVPLTHGHMIENGFNIGERQGLRPGDHVLLAPPLFWSYGAANAMMASFTHGAALVLQGKFEAGEAIELIEQHQCTAIYALPGITSAIIHHPSFRPQRTQSLRTGVTIGSPQDIQTAADVLGAREICNIYGQTESYGNCCVTWHHWPLERRMRVQGPPLPGVTVRIVAAGSEKEVELGQPGLIEVKGHLTRGYEGASSAQNEAAFTSDGFFRTGDLGLMTPEGDLQFVGRDTEMIKRAGINIAPAEVEELLQRHPAVVCAGVAGAEDREKGELIVAFIVRAPGAGVSAEELRAHCRSLAATYKTPDHVEFCDALPTTPTGKLLRRELKRIASDISAGITRNN